MSRRSMLLIALSTSALAVACMIGPGPEDLIPSRRAEGDSIVVALVGKPARTLQGELLAADSTHLSVRVDSILQLPWSQISSIRFLSARTTLWVYRRPPSPEQLKMTRRLSRLPQGLDSATTETLRRALTRAP